MKKNKINSNYLERIPVINKELDWSRAEKDGLVTLHVKNKGIIKRITQVILRKPKVSHIHLDENGSFAWLQIDGEKSIADIGIPVKEHFGEAAEPLYPRLAQFFKVLEDNKLIEFKK
ncbi:MAG: PqqD family protein [Ruminococcaceae bacterium]|nr:PqqD family protein [Oscillospiraceae bacterium]